MVRFVFALAAALVACSSLADAKVMFHGVRPSTRGLENQNQAQSYSDYQQAINQYKYNYNNGNQNGYAQNDDAAAAANDDAVQQQGDDQAAAATDDAADFYEESDATDTVYEEGTNMDTSDSSRFKIDGAKWLKTKNALEVYRMTTILFASLTVTLLAYVWYLRRKLVPTSERLINEPTSVRSMGEETAVTQGTYKLDDMEAPPTVTIA